MKFSLTFVLSLVLLETCYCQTFEQLSKSKSTLFEKVKSLVSSKIAELAEEIAELENSTDLICVEERNLPKFSDPLIIGNFDQVPILIANNGWEKIDYKGVEFHGLHSANTANYRIDNNNKEVILFIPLSEVEVRGHYTAFNISGNFSIHLVNNVTYIQTTQFTYSEKNGPKQLELKTSQGQVYFDDAFVEFENTNFGIFDDKLLKEDRTLGLIIEQNVFGKIIEEVDSKMATNIELLIENRIGAVMNRLDNELHDIINKIYELIPRDCAVQVDLRIKNPEFEFNNTKIKISSIKLSGMENFYLNTSNIFHVGFYIGADFKLILPKPNASVTFTYLNGDSEKQVMAEYSIKYISADLSLGKDNMSVYGVELQNCVFGVSLVQPYLHQFPRQNDFEKGLIEHSTKILYQYIAGAIEDFFGTEVYNWVSPRTGEQKYFQRLRMRNETDFRDEAQEYYEIEVMAMRISSKKSHWFS